ncbi:MAG TPA: tetratricopeptide repeat protein, partial [Vicinamibacterales bacterium]|nr:tetratricopeptide repeat protein [Vicinamibacterales bacterium]
HLLSLHQSEMPLPRHLQGEHLHAALLDAVAAIVMVLARRSPLLLLLEDWHWADEASRDVVLHLAGILDSTAAALVVTSRPEGAGIAELSGRAEVVQLQPLDSASAEAILSAMFRVPRVSPELAARIHERTGGNPFFLEQVAHTLAEEGAVTTSGGVVEIQRDVDGLALPDTVQAVIRARLDRLSDDAREVLRVASVIGREFRRALLVAALDPSVDPARALDKLRAAGLIQQTHVLPEPAYRFKHVLTQEVAYGSLLEHQRRALHGVIGRALAQTAAERVGEVAESLALHFSRAELWPEAIEYGRHAVARLRDLGQYGDALTMVERVRSWLPHLPDDEARRTLTADILLEEERLCETVGQRGRQQQIINELIALLAPHGSSPQLAQAYLRQGDVLTLLESFDAADRAFSTALRLSREQSDAALERNCIRSIGLLRWHEGRHREALEMAERALAIDRARADDAAIAGDLANLGNVLLSLGEHDRARAVLEEALAMPVLADDLVRISYVLHNVANLHRALGDLDTAMAYLRRADDLAGSLPIQRSFHLISIAHIELQQGHVDDAVRTYEEAIELSRRARHATGLAQGLRALGELRLGLGQDVEALPLLREAAALFAQLESRAGEMHLLAQVGRLHERLDEWRTAREVWQNVRTLARTLGDRRAELDALEGLARTARRIEPDRAAVIEAFAQALPFAEAIGDDARAGALHNTLGILEWERGGYAAALAHYETGLRLWRRAGNRAHEGLMLNSVGVTLARLQRYEEACTALEQAAALNHASGERLLEAHALAALGEVSLRLGRRGDAADCYTRARDLRQALGDRDAELELSRRLADLGDPPLSQGE